MLNLHNLYKSDERKISQKNPHDMMKYSFPCFWSLPKKKTNFNKGQLKKFLFLVMAVTLDEEQGC
jgi:hypothetical protein